MIEQPEATIPPPRPWGTRLKTCWLFVFCPVVLVWSIVLVQRMVPPQWILHDFVQEWTSARNYFTGEPIYLDLKSSVSKHMGGGYSGTIQYNAHPPASVLLLLPLGLLDYQQAFTAWSVISCLFLAGAVWLVLSAAGLRCSAWMTLPVVVVLLTSNALAQQINQGQLNLLLLFLIVVAWTQLRRRRDITAGCCLGLAAAVKLFPAFLLVFFVVRRRWQGLFAAIVMGLAVTVISVVVLGVDAYVSYIFTVLPQVKIFSDWWANMSLAGFFNRLFDAPSGHVDALLESPLLAKSLIVVSCLMVVAVVVRRCWTASTPLEEDLAFGAAVIALVLLSPVAWDHYFLLLLLPIAMLWRYVPQRLPRTLTFALVLILLTLNPKIVWDQAIPGNGEVARKNPSIATPWQSATVISYPVYSVLALFALMAGIHPTLGQAPAVNPLRLPEAVRPGSRSWAYRYGLAPRPLRSSHDSRRGADLIHWSA